MDTELLNRLYQRYRKELYLYLYALCKNEQLAEDLLQETFLKALLSLPDGHMNIRAWLYMVARNLFFNYRRHTDRLMPLEDWAKESADRETPEVLNRLIAEENKKMLYRAMANLELKKREILQMQYFGGLSQKEIAAILHLTPENVRVLAYRAKKELKSYLEVNGYDVS